MIQNVKTKYFNPFVLYKSLYFIFSVLKPGSMRHAILKKESSYMFHVLTYTMSGIKCAGRNNFNKKQLGELFISRYFLTQLMPIRMHFSHRSIYFRKAAAKLSWGIVQPSQLSSERPAGSYFTLGKRKKSTGARTGATYAKGGGGSHHLSV